MLHLKIKRPGEEFGQPGSRERNVDAIGPDFYPAVQRHEQRFDFIRCLACELFGDLPAGSISWLCSEPLCELPSRASRIAPGSAKKLRSLAITRPSKLPAGIRRPMERFLPIPVTREVET